MQLNRKDIILYPTDTIYGLGVIATDSEAVLRLKDLKGRDEEKPISVAVADEAMLRQYTKVTPLAEKLIEKFLPGKLTLILNVQDAGLEHLAAQDGSVGFRIPDRKEALDLIQEIGAPITATSANVSGMSTEYTSEKILEQFGKRSHEITQVVDVGELPPSEASTVVDARGDEPVIVREGAVPTVAILKALG